MKKLIILSIGLHLLTNCSNDKKNEESSSLSDAIGSVKNLNTLTNSMDDITKRSEELTKMTPLTNEEFKAVMPESVMGLKRTSISVGDNMVVKMSSANAEYNNEDRTKTVKIEIMDGAGESGSAMAAMMKLGFTSMSEKTTENGFEKTGDYNGVKSKIKETKYEDQVNSEISYLTKDRYIVTIEGIGYSVDELKSVMSDIDSSNLK